MKCTLFSIVFTYFIIHSVLGQIAIPLQYGRNNYTQDQKSYRHNMLRQEKTIQHKVKSRLAHNIDFIKKHFGNSQGFNKTRNHQLKTQDDQIHLRIETFNLQPSAYAFSLPMKIDGLKYKMSIDSGSSDIFIKGENAAGKPKRRYHCGQVCIDTHDHYKIGYLDGRLQTYETKLQVQIGQHKFNQSILVAYKVDHNFQQNQGLIGLSFAQLATNPNPTFLQTLKNQQIIDVYAFGVNLNFQDDSRSFITFGHYDPKFFQGELDYFPLTSNLFYYIKSQGFSIGDSDILTIRSALFDTGNTCISIPHKFQDDILNQFNRGENNNQNKCFFSVQNHADMFSVLRCKVGDFDALPVLNIHLGGKTYSIQKQYYLQACDRRPSEMQSDDDSMKGIWYCDTYIESVTGMSQLFLGDGFFNRYYTYFNLESKKIGITKNKEVIELKKIIQNQLDADQQDWQEILTKLNQDQSRSDIKRQISQAAEQQKNTKKNKKDQQESQSSH